MAKPLYYENPELNRLLKRLCHFADIKSSYGAGGIDSILAGVENTIRSAISDMSALAVDPDMARREPDDLEQIRRLRPVGPRRLWTSLDLAKYRPRLEGAFLGRVAGNILGVPVEAYATENHQTWRKETMTDLARETGMAFPPTDYWIRCPDPYHVQYGVSEIQSFTRDHIDGVPIDDDLMYTVLGLLIMEDFGPGFSTDEVAKAWLKYVPTAGGQDVQIINSIKEGCSPEQTAKNYGPYWEGLGAGIRCDSWGYLAAGWPERAAEMAYHDAMLSHRRQGVYNAMFFAAAIAAGFAVDEPREALEIALTEIPAESAMAECVRWSLEQSPHINDYQQAERAVFKQYGHLPQWNSIPNACLTIWGLVLGGRDFTRVIGQTVAMGWDNDCTAATAGSVCGATIGKKNIPEHWYRNFHDRMKSYLIGHQEFSIRDLFNRYEAQAGRVWATAPKT